MIIIQMSFLHMVNSMGTPREAKSQCKSNATFWLGCLMEIKELIYVVIDNATFVVCQFTTCANVLITNELHKWVELYKLQGSVHHANVHLAKIHGQNIDNFHFVKKKMLMMTLLHRFWISSWWVCMKILILTSFLNQEYQLMLLAPRRPWSQ